MKASEFNKAILRIYYEHWLYFATNQISSSKQVQ